MILLHSQKYIHVVVSIHATILTCIGIFILSLLSTPPSIHDVNVSDKRISVNFDHPVKRKILRPKISPDTPGIWVYEDPLYHTHLYRRLSYHTYAPIPKGQQYTIYLEEISNMYQLTSPFSASISLGTSIDQESSHVLGIQAPQTPESIQVTGIFPSPKSTGISTDQSIKVTFNQAVIPSTAEERLILTPQTQGVFRWEGYTMIFTPVREWNHDTTYTAYIPPGIKNESGISSTFGYQTTFTTQQSIIKLSVPFYFQAYALSCEAAALRMALAYRGIYVSEDELLTHIGKDPTPKNGSVWGNPHVGFVGNVRGRQMIHGYGVYWEPITKAANHYRYATSFTDWNIKNITENIQKHHPIIIWGYVKKGEQTTWNTPGGDNISAVSDEHTVLVIGYVGSPSNPTHIIVHDPLQGEAYWKRDAFEQRWSAFKKSGVVVY